jgi:hypothetical protein
MFFVNGGVPILPNRFETGPELWGALFVRLKCVGIVFFVLPNRLVAKVSAPCFPKGKWFVPVTPGFAQTNSGSNKAQKINKCFSFQSKLQFYLLC